MEEANIARDAKRDHERPERRRDRADYRREQPEGDDKAGSVMDIQPAAKRRRPDHAAHGGHGGIVGAGGRIGQHRRLAGLDQPVSDFITEWKGTPKAKMTIRHVLSMHTGLLEQAFAPGPDNHWSRAYMDPYHERYLIHEYPLTDEPGNKYAYSNAAADLVALIIMRATGQAYDEFLGQHVLQPIGAVGGTIWLNRENGVPHSGCCINLPAQSWLKLAVLLHEDGQMAGEQLLPKGFVPEMRKPSADNPVYGLGIWLGQPYAERRGFMGRDHPAAKVLHSARYLADDLFLLDGNGNQVAYIIPSKKLVVLRMGSSPPQSKEWDNSYIPNTLLMDFEKNRLFTK